VCIFGNIGEVYKQESRRYIQDIWEGLCSHFAASSSGMEVEPVQSADVHMKYI